MGNKLSKEAEMSRKTGASGEGGITINIGIFFISCGWQCGREG